MTDRGQTALTLFDKLKSASITEQAPKLPADLTIDFWFEFGSNYSYLSVMRIESEAAKHGLRVRWRPFLLAPFFRGAGWGTSPFVLQKEKGAYVWQDTERQCKKYGLPWKKPTVFPRSAVLPMRVATLGAKEPWIEAYCKATMLQNFVHDLDIEEQANVEAALVSIGLDADSIIRAATSDANKLALRANTDYSLALGVFGAPTFFVRGEMFWGNDRLDEAIAYAASLNPTLPT